MGFNDSYIIHCFSTITKYISDQPQKKTKRVGATKGDSMG